MLLLHKMGGGEQKFSCGAHAQKKGPGSFGFAPFSLNSSENVWGDIYAAYSHLCSMKKGEENQKSLVLFSGL